MNSRLTTVWENERWYSFVVMVPWRQAMGSQTVPPRHDIKPLLLLGTSSVVLWCTHTRILSLHRPKMVQVYRSILTVLRASRPQSQGDGGGVQVEMRSRMMVGGHDGWRSVDDLGSNELSPPSCMVYDNKKLMYRRGNTYISFWSKNLHKSGPSFCIGVE